MNTNTPLISEKSPRVLVADDDPVVTAILRAMLPILGYTPICVEDGEAALAVLEAPDAPAIALIDWMMPKQNGLAVVHRTRRSLNPHTYFILLTGRGTVDLPPAFAAGINDVLFKPIVRKELEARLAVARSAVERGQQEALAEVLREAMRDPEGSGEVIVSGATTTGRIHLDRHKVVWVRVLPEPIGIGHLLERDLQLSIDEVRAVVEECRTSRRTFDVVIVEWKLATMERLRACLRHFFTSELQTLRELQPLRAAFFPGVSRTGSSLQFSLEEVAPWALEPLGPRPPSVFPQALVAPPDETAERRLEVLRNLEGLETIVVLDLLSGSIVANEGSTEFIESAWALVRALEYVDLRSEESPEELMSATARHFFLVHRAASSHGRRLAVFLGINRATGNLAMSRLELARACALE